MVVTPRAPPRVSKPVKQTDVAQALKSAAGDCLITALWVMCSSLFAEVAEYLAQLSGQSEILIGLSVLVGALALFAPLCNALNGAIFNPLNSIALVSSSHGTFATNALRMGGQLVGAVIGAVAAIKVVPAELQGKFHTLSGGLKDGVAFELGVACEGTLSFVLNYIFLMSIDSKSKMLTVWVPLLSAILLTYVGFHFTGPSLNPFISFSWHFHFQKQSLYEHIIVFWAAPVLGALAAGFAYVLVQEPAGPKRRRRTTLPKKRQ